MTPSFFAATLGTSERGERIAVREREMMRCLYILLRSQHGFDFDGLSDTMMFLTLSEHRKTAANVVFEIVAEKYIVDPDTKTK